MSRLKKVAGVDDQQNLGQLKDAVDQVTRSGIVEFLQSQIMDTNSEYFEQVFNVDENDWSDEEVQKYQKELCQYIAERYKNI